MKRFFAALTAGLATVLLLGLLLAAGGWLCLMTAAHGFSARAEPSHAEATLAAYARAAAMPRAARRLKNPVVLTPAVQQEAMAHYADHCAVCHANDGSGQSMFGKGLYPRPPDLRGDTQKKSDGELFYAIENGIRLSGMPAFGGDGTADASWKLVAFIRHLPQLTSVEETQMEALNPKTPEEAAEEKQEEQFLNGDSPTAPAPTAPATSTTSHLKGHTR